MNDKLNEIEVETEETEVVETDAAEEAAKPESTEETIRKVYEQLEKGEQQEIADNAEKAANSKETATEEEATEQAETAASTEEDSEKQAKNEQEEEQIAPPERWTAKAKEWFRAQPKEAQREFARATADMEAQTTKIWQNLRRQEAKYKEIDQVIEHYAHDLHSKGITHQQAIAEFFAANRALDQEPVAALARIMQAKGVTPDQIAEHLKGGGTKAAPVNPEIHQLRSTVEELNNWKQEQLQTVQARAVQAIAQEFAAVRDEVDATGRYKYPKLHEPEQTDALKPLVRGIRESQPDLPWGDALRKAYEIRFGTPSATPAARLQAPQNSTQQNNSRARTVAVAGKSSGSSSSSLNLDDVKVPKRTEDTIRLAMRLLGS